MFLVEYKDPRKSELEKADGYCACWDQYPQNLIRRRLHGLVDEINMVSSHLHPEHSEFTDKMHRMRLWDLKEALDKELLNFRCRASLDFRGGYAKLILHDDKTLEPVGDIKSMEEFSVHYEIGSLVTLNCAKCGQQVAVADILMILEKERASKLEEDESAD